MKTLRELTDAQWVKILNLRANKFPVQVISERYEVEQEELKKVFISLDNEGV